MAKIWKIYYPATLSRSQPKNFSGPSSWNCQRDSESLESQLIAVYSQCCCYSNRDAKAWTQEWDRTPVQQLHLLLPRHGFPGYTLSPGSPEPPQVAESNTHSQLWMFPTWLPRTAKRGKQGASAAQGVQATVEREEQHQSASQPLKAQPSFPPLETPTLFPQQQQQRSHPKGNSFLYTFSEDSISAGPCFSTF